MGVVEESIGDGDGVGISSVTGGGDGEGETSSAVGVWDTAKVVSSEVVSLLSRVVKS